MTLREQNNYMADTIAMSPGTTGIDTAYGDENWNNPDNVKVSNNTYATTTATNPNGSYRLKATNFGFSIPTGVTITGIKVEVESKTGVSTTTMRGQIIKGGSIIYGSYRSFNPGTIESYKNFGGFVLWTEAWTPAQINSSDFGVAVQMLIPSSTDTLYVDHIRITVRYDPIAPTVTTQAVSAIADTTATGNGNITATGGENATRRGFCYKLGTSGDPTTSDSTTYDDGDYGTGAYTKGLTGLSIKTGYRVRAYAINGVGTSYGDTVQLTTLKADFTNPTNAYSEDASFATTPGTDGKVYISLSKDGGTTWTSELEKTFDGNNGYLTFGDGDTELWGTTFTGDDVDDTSFALKIRASDEDTYQIYKTFGFAITATYILTGIEVKVKAKWITDTTSIDHIEAKIYYGTSTLPIQAGSQAYASDGRKAGEGAGSGSGVLVFYDGTNWIACDTGATVDD